MLGKDKVVIPDRLRIVLLHEGDVAQINPGVNVIGASRDDELLFRLLQHPVLSVKHAKSIADVGSVGTREQRLVRADLGTDRALDVRVERGVEHRDRLHLVGKVKAGGRAGNADGLIGLPGFLDGIDARGAARG